MNDRVGQQLGNYRLNSLIGKGGFGEVYLAEHIHLGTLAAIKMLSVQLGSEEAENFQKEARIIARLIHPNIIRVLDYGVYNSIPYLVMDFAPNGTLRQRHPAGSTLSLEVVVLYVKQIAEALFYGHEQGVIHRDVKPQNMLIGRNNEILLSDFGIAVISSSSISRPTEDIAGTPVYMAPEQFEGKLSRASDQYSLGIVVYEWLCGSPPFQEQATLVDTAIYRLTASPPSLRSKNPNIPSIVEKIVLKALEKDIHRRFGNVIEFAKALERAVSEEDDTTIQLSSHSSTIDKSSSRIETPLAPALQGVQALPPPAYNPDAPTIKADTIYAGQGPEPYLLQPLTLPSSPYQAPGNTYPYASPWQSGAAQDDFTQTSESAPSYQYPPYQYVPPDSTALFPGSILPDSQLKDSFIIYSKTDRIWGEWVAWQLHHAGYTTILPVWGVLPGTDIELEIQKAAAKAKRIIIVFSPALIKAVSIQSNWLHPFQVDAMSGQYKLLPIYVRDSRGKYRKFIEAIQYIEFSKMDEEKARLTLLEVMAGEYIKPSTAPIFPGTTRRASSQKRSSTASDKPSTGNSSNEQPVNGSSDPHYTKEEKNPKTKEQSTESPMTEKKAIEIFFSYSHKDKKLRDELEKYMHHLKRHPLIKAWHDGEIGAGKEYAQEILQHLNEAHIILLLISQDFIASNYCYNIEMQKALERHEAKTACVIPIILRSAFWESTPIGKLQALPTEAKPITEWPNRNQAFMDVVRGIQREIEKMVGKI
jgi:serine/threonine protein kinase